MSRYPPELSHRLVNLLRRDGHVVLLVRAQLEIILQMPQTLRQVIPVSRLTDGRTLRGRVAASERDVIV